MTPTALALSNLDREHRELRLALVQHQRWCATCTPPAPCPVGATLGQAAAQAQAVLAWVAGQRGLVALEDKRP